MAAQVVSRGLAFQCEVEIFRIARKTEGETQARTPLERQRGHRPHPLERSENAALEVLPSDVAAPRWGAAADEPLQMILHSLSYSGIAPASS